MGKYIFPSLQGTLSKHPDPNTWDNNYRTRQMELAGVLYKMEDEIKNNKNE